MNYLLDMHTSPPVVVKAVREGDTASVELAQRYADQTKHVLVWTKGPDSVTDPTHDDVVHPVGHAPAPVTPQLAMSGVNLAPPRAVGPAADLNGVWAWLKGEARTLEGPAEELAKQLLHKLLEAMFK